MFDVGWSELLIIGVVALIVVGPEDLPRMFRALGKMTAKARSMAREFSNAMEDAARESGIKEATDGLREVRSLTSKKSLGLDALESAANRFEQWDPKLPARRAGMQPDPSAAGSAVAAMATPADPVPAEALPGPALGSPASAAPPAGEADAAAGQRRLHAVRRQSRS